SGSNRFALDPGNHPPFSSGLFGFLFLDDRRLGLYFFLRRRCFHLRLCFGSSFFSLRKRALGFGRAQRDVVFHIVRLTHGTGQRTLFGASRTASVQLRNLSSWIDPQNALAIPFEPEQSSALAGTDGFKKTMKAVSVFIERW